MTALSFIRYIAAKIACHGGEPGDNGSVANGVGDGNFPNSQMKKLCADASGGEGGMAASLLLPGASPEERAEVDSWVDFAGKFSAEHLQSMDDHLRGRAYLAGNAISLGDVAVYFASAASVAEVSASDPSSIRKFLNFFRWFNQMQHRVKLMAPGCEALPSIVPLVHLFAPVPVPLPAKRPSPTKTPPAAPVQAPANDRAVPSGASGAATSALPPAGQGNGSAPSTGAAGASAGALVSGNGSAPSPPPAPKEKERKKKAPAKNGSATPAAATRADEADPSKLDMRVGYIVKAWEHPDSEKLFCEEIDLGEGKTRNIASGLRAFYTLEEMQARRVLVLANLKARKIGGFNSEGMYRPLQRSIQVPCPLLYVICHELLTVYDRLPPVTVADCLKVLCASNADHTAVKIIEPPPDAPVGSRVTVEGVEGEPATPAQVQKKKVLEKCAPKLRVTPDGIPAYDGKPLHVEGVKCLPTMPDAIIS